MAENKIKMAPVLEGDFWMIGDNPDLGELDGNRDPAKGTVQECVDHHIFFANDNKWHLWGCIRGTKIGRLLYHWRADKLSDRHWEKTGGIFRSEQQYGEDMCHLYEQEWIQSPYVVKENNKYYMFYGGNTTEWDIYGRAKERVPYPARNLNTTLIRGQMCLMISDDGINWKRYLNPEGQTRLFVGPGQARDPMVLKVGKLYYSYYAGAVMDPVYGPMAQVYLRVSDDLLHWSDYSVVHYDYSVNKPETKPAEVYSHECPFVVEHEGYYYLLRTENYAKQLTHVYRSEDPRDFGLGEKEASVKHVGILPVGAPEIIRDLDGNEYISSNHNLAGGTMLCRLGWKKA